MACLHLEPTAHWMVHLSRAMVGMYPDSLLPLRDEQQHLRRLCHVQVRVSDAGPGADKSVLSDSQTGRLYPDCSGDAEGLPSVSVQYNI